MIERVWIQLTKTINIDSKMILWESKKFLDIKGGMRWFAIIWESLIQTMLNNVQQKNESIKIKGQKAQKVIRSFIEPII